MDGSVIAATVCCAAVAAFLAVAIEVFSLIDDQIFDRGDFVEDALNRIKPGGKLRVVLVTLAIGAGALVAWGFSAVDWANWLCFGAVLAVMVGTAVLVCAWDNRLRELIPALALILLGYVVARKLLVNIVAFDGNAVWLDPFLLYGTFVMLIGPALLVAYRLWTEANQVAAATETKKPSVLRNFGWMAAALVVGVALVVGANNALAVTPSDTNTAQVQVVEDQTTDIDLGAYTGTVGNCIFYNFQMVNTGEPFNFGPNPVKDGMTAADYKQDLRTKSSKDPALLAAITAYTDAMITAYTDAIVHTRFMGVFYDQVSGQWDAAINAAKDAWIADAGAFQSAHTNFWAFMDNFGVQLDTNSRQCQDLMYMNPYTGKSSPDVIVLATDQATGPWLVFRVEIKGNIFEIPFRIPCGYQPSDCQRIMGIQPSAEPTPTATPAATSTPSGGGSTPGNPGGGGGTPDEPTPPPSQNTTWHKDSGDSSNHEKGDGADPSTNNGVGSQTSAADSPTGSGSMGSYDDYRDAIGQIEQANQDAQQQQGSGNAASTPPQGSSTNVDNNGNTGTGNGGVDTPSGSSGQVTPVQGDSNAQPWSGPSD